MKRIHIGDKKIYIDGKPTKIISGAIHYFRVHPAYWRDRLLKLKECGFNCVETYLIWGLHEKNEGEFDFSGWLDFGKFLDIAQELGLYAIVRPGPYICSEWDFGGMPWWLLRYPDIELRCSQPLFLEKITPFMKRACGHLRPHMLDNGGNVIFVQIENEYGSYGNDKEYLRYHKALYESEGIDGPFITADGPMERCLRNGTLPDVMAAVDYRWESVHALATLQKHHGGQPGAAMELWNGKAQHWGEPFLRRDLDEVALSIRTALENAELVNVYMFHGGTTFGFMNGALDFGAKLIVQATSYDVDAPLDEYGRRTPKYYAEQRVICDYLGKTPENTASDTVLHTYEGIRFAGEATLTQALARKTKSLTVRSMETYGQGYGYIVYETRVFVGPMGAKLLLPEVHDIAHVYVDGVYKQTLGRHDADKTVLLEEHGERRVSILVENLGRVNYGLYLKDRKGLVGDVNLFDTEHTNYAKPFGWDIYSIELNDLPTEWNGRAEQNAPAFYRYTFHAEKACDTLLRLDGFTRGVAFINGFNLGRHWTIEHSENKLFIPAPLIREGENEIVVFDVLATDAKKSVRLGE